VTYLLRRCHDAARCGRISLKRGKRLTPTHPRDGGQDRRRRRDPGPRAAHYPRVPRPARPDRRPDRGRLMAAHRGHRNDRRRRVRVGHGPEEGTDHYRGRGEHSTRGGRRRARGAPADRPGPGRRRRPAVRDRPAHAGRRGRTRLGPSPWHHGRLAYGPGVRPAGAGRGGDRGSRRQRAAGPGNTSASLYAPGLRSFAGTGVEPISCEALLSWKLRLRGGHREPARCRRRAPPWSGASRTFRGPSACFAAGTYGW
jgi:hypothetical protein